MIIKCLGKASHFHAAFTSRWRNFLYRLLGVHFGGYAWLRKIEIPRNWSSISIGKGVALDHGVQLLATTDSPLSTRAPDASRLRIGEGTYINRFTILDAHRDLRIGEGCMIGPFCYLSDADHDHSGTRPVRETAMQASFLHIGDGAWIGSHCVLLPGITIGKNAVIGAGSIVTSDIPENAIAYGSPAKIIRSRTLPP